MAKRKRPPFRIWIKRVDDTLEWEGLPSHSELHPYEYWYEIWCNNRRSDAAARQGIKDFDKRQK